MRLSLDFLRVARLELFEAAIWYQKQHTNLGTDFILEIDRCLGLIAEQPELFAPVCKNVRRITAKRFPYSIYFRATAERILVIAVFHNRRSPAVWQRSI